MRLLTKEILAQLPPLYSQDGLGDNAIAVVKFFDPTGSWTWYASEGSFVCPNHAAYECQDAACTIGGGPWSEFSFFGLVFGHKAEYGYFYLSELTNLRVGFGLRIERDILWKPKSFRAVKALHWNQYGKVQNGAHKNGGK